MTKSRTRKRNNASIAVLGPKNTFSDLGAEKYLKQTKQNLHKDFTRSIEEVFELVAKGKCEIGIAPIENKLYGTVRETIDNLFEQNVHVVAEVNLPIYHCLVTLTGAKKTDIKRIISHSQALNQSKKFLRKNFPKAELEDFASTAGALEKLLKSKDETLAVIAQENAVTDLRLQIFAKNIEDRKDNSTTFVIIKKGLAPLAAKAKKTLIAFYFSANKPGTLFSVLQIFSKHKLDMTKIESRPTKKKFGEYIFYLDFIGSLENPQVKKALKQIESKVAFLKVLGSA